jgi:hypothetical protein
MAIIGILGRGTSSSSGSGGTIGIGSPTYGWAYQDFSAGTIGTTNVTLTANENGTGVTFVPGKVVSNTAIIVLADANEEKAYTGTSKLFSTLVNVSSHTGVSVNLTGVPHVSWGDIRVYYYYRYDFGLPDDYTMAPKSISREVLNELNALFITEEEFIHNDLSGLQGGNGVDEFYHLTQSQYANISGGGSGGATDFTDLGDTPGNYSGAADYRVVVNGSATGLTFEEIPDYALDSDLTDLEGDVLQNTSDIASISGDLDDRVIRSGDTMTGALGWDYNSVSTETNNASNLGLTGVSNVIDSFAHNSNLGAAEWLVISTNGSASRTSKIIAVYDSTNATHNEYVTSDIGTGNTLDLELRVINSGGNINLIANTSSGTWNIKCFRVLVR